MQDLPLCSRLPWMIKTNWNQLQEIEDEDGEDQDAQYDVEEVDTLSPMRSMYNWPKWSIALPLLQLVNFN